MSKFTQEKTSFFVVRNRNGEENAMQFDQYSGAVYWNPNSDTATQFETAEDAKKHADVQGLLAQITGQTATFEVFRKHEKTGPDGKVETVEVESEEVVDDNAN